MHVKTMRLKMTFKTVTSTLLNGFLFIVALSSYSTATESVYIFAYELFFHKALTPTSVDHSPSC